MPILETSRPHPPAAADPFTQPRWYACYTRGCHEKKVETQLRSRGVEVYLPVIVRPSERRDRRVSLRVPLFPSYVFGRFALNDLHLVLSTVGVSTVVRHRGQPAAIPDPEMDNVRRAAAALGALGAEPEVRPYVAEGERVRITGGPFAGVEGVVLQLRGASRVLVGLALIGQGFHLAVEERYLERVSARP